MEDKRHKPTVFVLMPFGDTFEDVYAYGIMSACHAAGTFCERVDALTFDKNLMDIIYDRIAKADIIIADITSRNPNVLHEVGYAFALKKQVILIAHEKEDLPFDLAHHPHLIYQNIASLRKLLESKIRLCIDAETAAKESRLIHDGGQIKKTDEGLNKRNQVLISYSHKDAKWLERLQVHLKPLEHAGTITRWDDTIIKPGQKWQDEIKNGLESAKVAILLVTADFLASDFITKNELPPLLAAAETHGAVILPVIVSPCRFEETKSLSKFHAVNPPSQPLSKLTKARREEYLVKITRAVEAALNSGPRA